MHRPLMVEMACIDATRLGHLSLAHSNEMQLFCIPPIIYFAQPKFYCIYISPLLERKIRECKYRRILVSLPPFNLCFYSAHGERRFPRETFHAQMRRGNLPAPPRMPASRSCISLKDQITSYAQPYRTVSNSSYRSTLHVYNYNRDATARPHS